jgi:putative membrane-bound dehydrogenase-like protein
MWCLECVHSRVVRRSGFALFTGALLLISGLAIHGVAQTPADWKNVKVPEVWKNPPAGIDNLSWYRGFIKTPDDWKGKDLELFVEPSDAAHEVFFNGKRVGGAGEFPPFFRSGLGGTDRFFVSADSVRYDAPNTVAIRVYNLEGRTGFNLAAPVLFGENAAVRMIGDWQFRPGDNANWAKYDAGQIPDGATIFAKVENALEVQKTLKAIDDAGPQAPLDEQKQLTTLADLEIELALSEPEVRQPLSIKWDPRGRLWVNEFIQYPDPAGLKMVSRDKFLRTVYDKVPAPPPDHFPGLDRISYHEDTDGDAKFDKHGVFVEGLSLTTSFAFDKDGLWVLQPPYLLFYPDKDHDDKPDGDPVVHLEGFGMEDSHSIANSLRWGPDGWLYGAQGSTVTGDIKRPGDKSAMHSLGQLIWRYHPPTRRYEIFAEGGGNTFGVELDAHGRIYSGHNGGDTRGFHYVQGGYYRKGFEKHGALSNPFAFGFFESMKHDKVPRFTHTFVIYEGGDGGRRDLSLPPKYRGNLFGVEPLQGRVVRSEVSPDQSSIRTKDLDYALTSKDAWCRPVDIQFGPDGALYVCDLYEQRIDHASHYQGRVDRDRGRIWRIKGKARTPLAPIDLSKASTTELIDLLQDPNRWYRQTALLVLSWKQPEAAVPELIRRLSAATNDSAVTLLWAVYQLGGLKEDIAVQMLGHPNPYVRLWAARVVCDEKTISSQVAARFAELAAREENVEVRSQLASSIRRLPASDALPLIQRMLVHDADAADIYLPLLIWWAIEDKAATDGDAIVSLLADREMWAHPLVRDHLLERLMRRFAAAGNRKDLLICATLLSQAPDADAANRLLAGFEKAYEGRSLAGLPDELVAAIAKTGGGSLALRLRQGDVAALDEALKLLADEKGMHADRLKVAQILADIHPVSAANVLLNVSKATADGDLQSAALAALQSYESPEIATTVVGLVPKLADDQRAVALNLLASRKKWAHELLTAIEQGAIAARSVPIEIVQRILFQRDEQNAALVEKLFGPVQGASTAEMLAQVESLKGVLAVGTGNPYNGRKLYINSCGKCHVLFGEGGRIGPDLTTYKRDDVHTILVNVVNPSAQIREGFENYVLTTQDGRTLTGFIADQDTRIVVIRGSDGQSVVVPRNNIEELTASAKSLMPEGILKEFSEQQIRDLFAYVRSTQPLAVR